MRPKAHLLISARLESTAVAFATATFIAASVGTSVATGVASSVGARTAVAASRVALALGLFLLFQKVVDVDEIGLLQELSAGDVQLLFLLGQETDVQSIQVAVHAELVLRLSASLGVFERSVERAEALDLHLLRLQKHLDETTAELLQHAEYDIGRIDAAVLRDVLRQLARVHRLQRLHLSKPLAVSHAVRVLVLLYFIQNLCHNNVCFFIVLESLRPTTSGGRLPALCLSF